MKQLTTFKNRRMGVSILALILASVVMFSNIHIALADDLSYTPILSNGPEINVGNAIVMDINSGAVLYAKNPTGKIQPSSLTKLVTAAVSIDKLDLNSSVSVSTSAASQDFPTASNAGLKSGDSLSVADAINGMLAISAEDCSVALAEKASGSGEAFAGLMNEYAEKNGFVNSHFSNPSGRAAAENYSCVYDIGLTASRLMRNHRSQLGALMTSSYTLSSCEIKIKNTHRFMNGTEKVENVYAGKTGGSAYGGNDTWAMCTYAKQGNLDLVCIIAEAPALADAYEATKALFSYSFSNYISADPSSLMVEDNTGIGNLFQDCPMFTIDQSLSLSADSLTFITLPVGADISQVTKDVKLEVPEHFVYGNNRIGAITFSYNQRYVGNMNIYYFSDKASMEAEEFNKLFPDFLISPESPNDSLPAATKPTTKTTIINKIKRAAYNIFTPAKGYSALAGLATFLVGCIIILIVFRIPHTMNSDRLYKKSIANVRDQVLPDDELSNVKRIRRGDDTDMKEIK